MYTAIQAKNIVDEKYNHRYMLLYKHCVNKIMRGIKKQTFIGKYSKHFYFIDAPVTYRVLSQICEEFKKIGYFCTFYPCHKKNSKKIHFYINWIE